MKNQRLKGPKNTGKLVNLFPLGKAEQDLWGTHPPPQKSTKDELFNFLRNGVQKEFQKGFELEADLGNPTEVQFYNFHPPKSDRQRIYQTVQRISEMAPSNSRLELTITQDDEGLHMGQLHLWSFAEELHLQRSAFTIEHLMEALKRDSEAKIQRWKKRRFQGPGEAEFPRETAS